MSNKPLANPTTFTGQAPPWSLTQLDANFAAVQAVINDTQTYSNYFVDQSGIANSIIVSIPTTLAVGLVAGTKLDIKINNTNTGPVTLTVNALAAQSVTTPNLRALAPNQLLVGQIATFQYDGTRFQFLGSNIAPQAGDIRNYGAISGQDASAAVALAAAANSQVVFPAGAWPMATTPTVPLGVVLIALPGSTFSGAGAIALALNNQDLNQWNVVEGTIAGANFVDVLRINHSYGGASMTGGRNSIEVQSGLTATSSASNTNRNYVAGAFQFNGTANDTGTNPTSSVTSAGAGFGLGAVAILGNGATAWLNVTGIEVNVACQTGSSLFYRSGVQIAELPTSAVQGAIFDGALAISRQTGAIGWQTGILFCAGNGSHPLTATGSLVATQGAYTTANGFNVTSYTFTGQSFAATGFAVQGAGNMLNVGISGSAHQILQTTSAAASYDTRIVSQSGTGTTGAGDLLLNSGKLGFFGAGAGGAKAVGYGTPTGNAYQPSFAAGAITLPNLAAAVAQLILDLKSYTLIGA